MLYGVLCIAPENRRDDDKPIDIVFFDGWHQKRPDAVKVYTEWCREFPNKVVALVERLDARVPMMAPANCLPN